MRRIDNSAQTWSEAGRTLVVQPLPGIGDMVWHVPQIHALAATTASRRVDLLTKPRSQAQHLFRADPSVERILWLERETAHRGLRGLWCLVRLLRELLASAGFADAGLHSSHSLRRGFASWANDQGWDMKALMEYVGWRDVHSAMRYIDGGDPFARQRIEASLLAPVLPASSL